MSKITIDNLSRLDDWEVVKLCGVAFNTYKLKRGGIISSPSGCGISYTRTNLPRNNTLPTDNIHHKFIVYELRGEGNGHL